jgi:hypothetical protein
MKGEYTKEIEALYALCEKMIEYHKRGDKASVPGLKRRRNKNGYNNKSYV